MPPSDPSPRTGFVGVGTSVAVILVVLGAVLPTMTVSYYGVGPVGIAGTIAIGVVYTAIGTLGVHAAERRDARRELIALTAALVVLGSVVVPLSHGAAWLMTMPAITMSVLFLSPAQATAAIALMGAVISVVVAQRAGSALRAAEDLVSHASGFAFVIVFSRMAKTQHQARARIEQLAGELAGANQQLRDHAAAVQDLATTRERNRIAREIHDGLGHYLTVVFVQLEAAEKLFAKDPARSVAAIAKARELTHEGLGEVRRAVSVLRGSTPAGRTLLSSLEALASASTEGGIDTRLEVHGAPRPLAGATEFALYRAAQEALTNVSRHAKAQHVKLDLVFTAPETVALRVEDDGIGCEQAEGGFGLVGLRERADLVGGTVAVETARGRGFAIELRVPG